MGAIRKWTISICYSLFFWDTTPHTANLTPVTAPSSTGAKRELLSYSEANRVSAGTEFQFILVSLQQSWSTERGIRWGLILCSLTTEWLGVYISYTAIKYQDSFTSSGWVQWCCGNFPSCWSFQTFQLQREPHTNDHLIFPFLQKFLSQWQQQAWGEETQEMQNPGKQQAPSKVEFRI